MSVDATESELVNILDRIKNLESEESQDENVQDIISPIKNVDELNRLKNMLENELNDQTNTEAVNNNINNALEYINKVEESRRLGKSALALGKMRAPTFFRNPPPSIQSEDFTIKCSNYKLEEGGKSATMECKVIYKPQGGSGRKSKKKTKGRKKKRSHKKK